MRLSADSFPAMFEPRHRELAERLMGISETVSIRGRKSANEANAVLAETGLYPHLIPKEGKLDVRALCTIREMLGASSVQADSIFAVQGLGITPVFLAGSEAQQKQASEIAEGRLVAGFGLTEPEAGSDVASLRCAATKTSNGYVLNGEKTLISNAGLASHYTVFATVDPERGRSGISAFWVPADTKGLVVEPLKTSVDHPLGRVVLNKCEVPSKALLGREGQGFELAMSTLDTFRVTVGAAAIGMARKAIDLTVSHVNGRTQFGKPLAAQPVVRSMLATMATDLDASALLVARAAWEKDVNGSAATVETAMAKLFATEAAGRIIDSAVQLHGGRGVLEGECVEELYRAVRPLRIYEGASEIQRLIIGRAIAKTGGQ